MTVHTKSQTEVFAALGALLAAMIKEQGESAATAPATPTPETSAAAPAAPARKFDPVVMIREAIGGDVAQIAQAMRLIQGDAEAAPSEPGSVIELAATLEETRERATIAYALLSQSVDRLNRDYGLDDYVWSPMNRAGRTLTAMREGGAA